MILEVIPLPPLSPEPAASEPPPPPVPQFPDEQLIPLAVPVAPRFPLPLAPPLAPAFAVAVLLGVKPPFAVIEPKLDAVPLFPVAPLDEAVAPPPEPVVTEIVDPGVTANPDLVSTPPPPPPPGQ